MSLGFRGIVLCLIKNNSNFHLDPPCRNTCLRSLGNSLTPLHILYTLSANFPHYAAPLARKVHNWGKAMMGMNMVWINGRVLEGEAGIFGSDPSSGFYATLRANVLLFAHSSNLARLTAVEVRLEGDYRASVGHVGRESEEVAISHSILRKENEDDEDVDEYRSSLGPPGSRMRVPSTVRPSGIGVALDRHFASSNQISLEPTNMHAKVQVSLHVRLAEGGVTEVLIEVTVSIFKVKEVERFLDQAQGSEERKCHEKLLLKTQTHTDNCLYKPSQESVPTSVWGLGDAVTNLRLGSWIFKLRCVGVDGALGLVQWLYIFAFLVFSSVVYDIRQFSRGQEHQQKCKCQAPSESAKTSHYNTLLSHCHNCGNPGQSNTFPKKPGPAGPMGCQG
ncbi:uncharacterized protein F5147DRAFT_756867 [Suillus discolor]|uniref:Uncharacterized protein n=1 Tax=Suillus discolor TaxID=1912936 RepID=A0A9P7FJE9_9AGAM|nr:uncharacterized protein F5147DRAFT_756867 [Suillus discolor]KAG2119470.1 hypothetical protein F5147DRAFT_756867 [Suillus discolor]